MTDRAMVILTGLLVGDLVIAPMLVKLVGG